VVADDAVGERATGVGAGVVEDEPAPRRSEQRDAPPVAGQGAALAERDVLHVAGVGIAGVAAVRRGSSGSFGGRARQGELRFLLAVVGLVEV